MTKTKKLLFISWCLAFFIFNAHAQAQFVHPSQLGNSDKDISFVIDRHPGWGKNPYTEDSTLLIRCTFSNKEKKDAVLWLADHDSYHGTMPYPFGMLAKVTDSKGNVITNTRDFGDWWTFYYLSSQSYDEMPGDRIKLKPGEKIVRIVPLAEVLRGLSGRREDLLKPGKYTVELRLGEIVSNKMSIQIVPKNDVAH